MGEHDAQVSGPLQIRAALTRAGREQVLGPIRVIVPGQVCARRARLLARLALTGAATGLRRQRGLARLVITAGRHRGVPAVTRDQPLQPGDPLRLRRDLRLQPGDLRVLVLQQRAQRLVRRPQPGDLHAQRDSIPGHTGRVGHAPITSEPALRKQCDTRSRPARTCTSSPQPDQTSGQTPPSSQGPECLQIFDVNQSTISRYISFLTPLIDKATAEFRPSTDEAAEATRGAIALVDGTLWPCWSWAGERELWAGKCRTTGHGSLIITNLAGRIAFVSEPVPGNQHDMAKLKGSECEMILKLAGGVFGDKGFIGTDYITTPVRKPKDRELYMREHDYNNQISSHRAPVERAVASLKTWRILFTDYRRPLKTFLSSFRAAIGLYFFKESFA